MFEITFAEKILVMKLIEKESIEKDFDLDPVLRDFYQKLQKVNAQ